jgi:cobalamin synthase
VKGQLVSIRHQLSLVLAAIQFLTRLPVPSLPGFQPIWLTRSARYFPLVGALVGAINVGVWWLWRHGLPPAASVGLMMAVSLIVTGAFHEDGFADSCDGLLIGADPVQAAVDFGSVDYLHVPDVSPPVQQSGGIA